MMPSNTTILSTTILACMYGISKASFDKIGPYTPLTDVSDMGSISNDQKVIETLMKAPTSSSFRFASEVYSEGGSSRTIATLDVPSGLPVKLSQFDLVTGVAVDGRIVFAAAVEDNPVGSTQLHLRYLGNGDFSNPSDCIIGGLPLNERRDDGCFAESGKLIIDSDEDEIEFNYTYTILGGNTNERTLQRLSIDETIMHQGGDLEAALYPSVQPFVDYYGRADYSDHIIQAALNSEDTDLLNGNLNMASAEIGRGGRSQIIKKGTAYLIMSMAALLELEEAVFQCESFCAIGDCNEDPNIFSLDEAVAYFVGQRDNFNRNLNNLRCAEFGTCQGDDAAALRGEAAANLQAFALFNEMREWLEKANCGEARAIIPKIASTLWIGLIQGTLRYAWITDTVNNPGARATEAAQAEGAIFAAGVLPMIEQCSPEKAKTIHDILGVNALIGADYIAVKEAFEECYPALGLTCEDIGGISGNGIEYDSCFTIPCGPIENFVFGIPAECSVPDSSAPLLVYGGIVSLCVLLSILISGP